MGTASFAGTLRGKAVNNKKLLYAGGTGSVIVAICCFTPVLVILLGAIGLSAWIGWLDYVLFPLLFLFIGITIFALIRKRKGPSEGNPASREERLA
jgi:mercuric ion transport protein